MECNRFCYLGQNLDTVYRFVFSVIFSENVKRETKIKLITIYVEVEQGFKDLNEWIGERKVKQNRLEMSNLMKAIVFQKIYTIYPFRKVDVFVTPLYNF